MVASRALTAREDSPDLAAKSAPKRKRAARCNRRKRVELRCPKCHMPVKELLPSELLDIKTLTELRVCEDCAIRAGDELWECDECLTEESSLLFELQYVVGDDDMRLRYFCEPCATAVFELERRYLHGPEDPTSSCGACGQFLEERRVWMVTICEIHDRAARARTIAQETAAAELVGAPS